MSRREGQTTLIDAVGTAPEPSEGTQALVPATPLVEMALMLERLANSPAVDVAKLEKIIDLQERILDRNARAAFDEAFAVMQPEIPQIDEKGRILVKGQLRSTYAKLEDIHEVIKPILAKHGFSVRHKTEWPADKPGIIRIIGILGHKQGHREQTEFEAPADQSDYRTDIQSQGSTVSYGRRYTTLDLLNISTRGQDNGGQGGKPEAPEGFEAFWSVLEGLASEGIQEVTNAFNKASTEFKNYMVGPYKNEWALLKNKAQAAGAARGARR